jgi:hypothetical protein
VLLATCRAPSEAPGFTPGTDGWLTLYDGSDLAKWKPEKGADWKRTDGILAGTRGGIHTYWHFLDFECLASCRGPGSLRFRISELDPMQDQPGYGVDLRDGTIRADKGRVIARGTGKPSPDWREVRLVVSEGRFTAFFDGAKVSEGADDAWEDMGRLAFVADGAPLQVRRLRARALHVEKPDEPTRNQDCYVCHANFENELLARFHLRKQVGCDACHGGSFAHRSDEFNVTVPDRMFTRGEVDAACLACHERHEAKSFRKDGNAPPPPNPVCTDCHGNHKVVN